MTVVTSDNAKAEAERLMSDIVDILAGFPEVELDPRAWNQLLIYRRERKESP